MTNMSDNLSQRNVRLAAVLLLVFVGIFVVSMALTYISTHPAVP